MIREQEIKIVSTPRTILEARLYMGNVGHCALLCHPHPLFGGTMDNNVILAARDVLIERSFSTLRFNFRGVGKSSGSYDDGKGETTDLQASFSFVGNHESGREGVHIVAYSFGAWIASKSMNNGLEPRTVVLISPPVDFFDFTNLKIHQCPTFVVIGDNDKYGSVEKVNEWLDCQPIDQSLIQRRVLTDVDHFYWGAENELKKAINEFYV